MQANKSPKFVRNFLLGLVASSAGAFVALPGASAPDVAAPTEATTPVETLDTVEAPAMEETLPAPEADALTEPAPVAEEDVLSPAAEDMDEVDPIAEDMVEEEALADEETEADETVADEPVEEMEPVADEPVEEMEPVADEMVEEEPLAEETELDPVAEDMDEVDPVAEDMVEDEALADEPIEEMEPVADEMDEEVEPVADEPVEEMEPVADEMDEEIEPVADEMDEEVEPVAEGEIDTGDFTITELASNDESFEILAAALAAADLTEILAAEGPYTVFAPTDDAFEALPEGTIEQLLDPANKDVLVQVLTYHVVPGAIMSTDLEDGEVATVEGSEITVALGDAVTVNDANVVMPDVEASNGVIHVIDRVIVPPIPEAGTEAAPEVEPEVAPEAAPVE